MVSRKKSSKRERVRGDNFSANFIARGELLQAIQEAVRTRQWTQTETAEFLGVTQPRISHLMQGRVDQFTVDMLMLWLEKLGKDVTVQVRNNVFASKEKVKLTLYVLGAQKENAIELIARLFGGDVSKFELKVIDVLEDPESARQARIIATPSLVKEWPEPRTVFVGDLSAASIRWQLATADERTRNERDIAQELKQASTRCS
ncbi:MAG TPA: XRE family transcriptional regulator [Oculatellaceae cyanobacterium]